MSEHELQTKHEIEEVPDPEFEHTNVRRRLTGKSQTTCTCGLDTGLIDSDTARAAFKVHYTQTTGTPWPANA